MKNNLSPIRLIEIGLVLWIKKKCEKINSLKIDIEGPIANLLKGKITSVRLAAKEIEFNGISFDEIQIKTDSISVNITSPFKLHQLELEDSFKINAALTIKEKSIREILINGKWHEEGNAIAKAILKKNKLENIQIKNNKIMITAVDEKGLSEAKCDLKTKDGTLFICNQEKINHSIPMDPLIFIEDVQINKMKLNIAIRTIIKTS